MTNAAMKIHIVIRMRVARNELRVLHWPRMTAQDLCCAVLALKSNWLCHPSLPRIKNLAVSTGRPTKVVVHSIHFNQVAAYQNQIQLRRISSIDAGSRQSGRFFAIDGLSHGAACACHQTVLCVASASDDKSSI